MGDLDKLYGSANGKTFSGEVVNHQTMYDKEWTVIEIDGGGSFKQILERIHHKGEGKVWKGFTGPPDYDSYRIWVELDADEGEARDFRVVGYNGPFHVKDRNYSQHEGYCFKVK